MDGHIYSTNNYFVVTIFLHFSGKQQLISENIIRVTKRLNILFFFFLLSSFFFILPRLMLNNKYVKLFLSLRDDNSHWFYFFFVVLMLYWSPGGETTAKLKYIILHEFIIINQFLNLELIYQGICLHV